MEGSERKEFLVGLFATWFATQRGREKPLKKDKQDAEAVAASAANLFDYRMQFGS